ncbi:MAG TPA: hypothetical protein VGS07_01305 [Thermoanaerobaculia bacterium]|jgi:hypothetical protein|nr:hypothetical protein [Thermoanaerobaculia bacterium]
MVHLRRAKLGAAIAFGFALNLFAVKPLIGGGKCCLICGGMTSCGCAVDSECGSCCVPPCCFDGGGFGSGNSLTQNAEKLIAVKLAVGKGNSQEYLVTRDGFLRLEDKNSGDFYVVHASWEGEEPKEISLSIEKIYRFFGTEFTRELRSVKLRNGLIATPIRVGPIAILGVGSGTK